MNKILSVLCGLIILAQVQTSNASDIHKKVVGTVQDFYCGEMDPFVVGDVCVLFVTNLAQTKTFGLLLDFDAGSENDSAFDKMRRSGRVLSVKALDLEDLKAEEIQVLEEFRGDVTYLRYTGLIADLLE